MQLVKGEKPLWEHQQDEVTRLEPRPRAILAWDMGTGKTRGSLERDLRLRERQPSLKSTMIVAPLGVHEQWARVVEEETGYTPYIINPKDRSAIYGVNARYYIVHYDCLRLEPKLRGRQQHIIFDECHRIKNRKAAMTRAAKLLGASAPFLTPMSGSPADDKPQDFWSILNILWPKSFTSYWKFFDAYVDFELVEKQPGNPRGGVYKKVCGVKPAWKQEGLPRLKNVYSRVRREDLAHKLPPLTHTVRYVDIYPIQRKHYAEFEKEMITWVKTQEGKELEPLIATAVIAKMQRLQQFALATMAYDEETDKYVMTLPSAKVDAVLEIIEDNEDEQFVIYSQYKGPLRLLRIELERRGVRCAMYTGDESNKVREQGRVDFSQRRARVFLATISAGGEALDGLQTHCSQMIFLDRAWKPKANEQAEGRLWRGGQQRPVQIINLMAKNTVDFERNIKIELKAGWIAEMLGDR